jgi:hypothetical protein
MITLPDMNLVVTIDTEEDNWGHEHSEFTVENIRMIPRLQDLFDRYSIRPTYLVTYQVVSCKWAADILNQLKFQNKCEIGSHLHPWNTPPSKEIVNERNSMLKNLPFELQMEKLLVLTDKIESFFGIRPQTFRAGRWGLGPETIRALIACNYLVDSSVTPSISWVNCGDGPEYCQTNTEQYWLSAEGDGCGKDNHSSILELPATIGFSRWPFEFWQKIYSILQSKKLKLLHLAGIAHRIGLLQKIWFSPEESSADDMITLARVMIANGARTLNLSFHSTSLLPGKSPFVRNSKELEAFYQRIEKILEYLSLTTRLHSLTLSDIRKIS